jgi:hypothetical protein
MKAASARLPPALLAVPWFLAGDELVSASGIDDMFFESCTAKYCSCTADCLTMPRYLLEQNQFDCFIAPNSRRALVQHQQQVNPVLAGVPLGACYRLLSKLGSSGKSLVAVAKALKLTANMLT